MVEATDRAKRFDGLNTGSAGTEKRATPDQLVQGLRGCLVGFDLADDEGDEESRDVMRERIVVLCDELKSRFQKTNVEES